MRILKFGGSTLQTPRDLDRIVAIVKAQTDSCAVVVSALSGVTDTLIELGGLAAKRDPLYRTRLEAVIASHQAILESLVMEPPPPCLEEVKTLLSDLGDILHGVFLVQEITPKTRDYVVSFGERLAATLVCGALCRAGIEAEYADARVFIKTDNRFGAARVYLDESLALIRSHFQSRSRLQVVPGFIGSTRAKETTTLGRGASDLTASLLGAALGAECIEIWTDTDGVMTADPKKVQKAISIDTLSYDEAMELAHFGARLLRPHAIQPARKYRIPIVIRNIHHPAFPGTRIGKASPSPYLIRGISSIDRIALLRLEGGGLAGVVGVASRLFSSLAREEINVILISQASSEHTICLAVSPECAEKAKSIIETEFKEEILSAQVEGVVVEKDKSIVAVVGEHMRKTPGIAARVFDALGKNGINVSAIAQGSSERNISVVIDRSDESKALNALHDAFFLSGTKTINLFLLGTGLIGSTLLRQIREHAQTIREQTGLDLRLVGLGNLEGWHMALSGIPLDQWAGILKEKGKPMVVEAFMRQMMALNLPNSIFIDCTASPEVVDHYEAIIECCISIVTPNKIANSGPLSRYRRLKEAASRRKVRFLYETNVGAGLPVISTLNDLIASGDRVMKIEGILSGTLSFIFNAFVPGTRFSDIVEEARRRGLSEPDPREDLSGRDVGRKLLILARECGEPMEPEDVVVEGLLPEVCMQAPSVEAFFEALRDHDTLFSQKRDEAIARGEVLRYIARLEAHRATVSLSSVGPDHPFYGLSGSDNMIVFTTERYHERPLVIKGPGAGAEVTAAGVFADILRIANDLSR